MTDKITGYRELSVDEIASINDVKNLAIDVDTLLENLWGHPTYDQRWLAIAKTQLQQGFMAAIRAVARPTTF
jgi:hypothetical protein